MAVRLRRVPIIFVIYAVGNGAYMLPTGSRERSKGAYVLAQKIFRDDEGPCRDATIRAEIQLVEL